MRAYTQPVQTGSPWIDYKEASKVGPELLFTFTIENFLSFVLREICITYPCISSSGESQLPIYATVNVSSTTNLFMPKPLPPELFSSPSQNFNLGGLNDDATGQRLMPIVFNYPCDFGDTLTVSVTGTPTDILIGCLIVGRKRDRYGN